MNTSSRVSRQGGAVLAALGSHPSQAMTVSALRSSVRAAAPSSNVSRASLSRTLRRLWAAGSVELVDVSANTLTAVGDRADRARRLCAALQCHPDAARDAYAAYVRMLPSPACDRFGSAGAYVAYWHAVATTPAVRVKHVRR